ncbi:hypothetical protein BT93_D0339 [Corymbia citriodora subsp. variegata]|nr:hypothetical protein BT93_D0339 [Corymbia citriodora subsp. variegata]
MFMHHLLILTMHIVLLGTCCGAKTSYLCAPLSCGEIQNISYPFRLKGNPKSCGHPKYELGCEKDGAVLYLYAGRYYVKSIHYDDYLNEESFSGYMRVVDDGLQKGNCSSLPRYSLAYSNFSKSISLYFPEFPVPYDLHNRAMTVNFVKCSRPVAFVQYIDSKPCIESAHSADMPHDVSQMKRYSYALLGDTLILNDLRVQDIKDSCTINMTSFATSYRRAWKGGQYNSGKSSYMDLHNMMAEGFTLSYGGLYSEDGSFRFCFLGFRYRRKMCSHYYVRHFLATKFTLGATCMLTFLIYKWRRSHLAMDENIEEFLQAHNNFLPKRYSYSDIKKITRNFKHKLGEGGYGFVYKGILRSGNEVAIKVLNKPKSNGQDFISEVGTIGRIHHVNVVHLVGFCFNNSKQALMYDFMLKGSLDKHIFSKDGNDSLDYKRIYEISLGVARGIEYLHRGCDMQILHFDIKPHNILLDQNFTPKVFDFGLAKLYLANHNIVSLTIARGILGYMALELFYKDIGGVSYKADVYSFGMMLMEMAGKRRNVNANIIRKMVLVALWCIQLIPNDRPSMSKVLNMLEGDVDELQLPPKPLLYPSEKPLDDENTEIELESFSTSPCSLTIF